MMTSKSRMGLSLIEAMISVTILAIGMLGSMSLMSYTRHQNELEQERARAHQIITEEMEQLRLELYTRLSGGSQVTVWDNGTPDDVTDDTMGNLMVQIRDPYTNTDLAASPTPAQVVELEVTLSWNPRGRMGTNTMRETLMTYVAP